MARAVIVKDRPTHNWCLQHATSCRVHGPFYPHVAARWRPHPISSSTSTRISLTCHGLWAQHHCKGTLHQIVQGKDIPALVSLNVALQLNLHAFEGIWVLGGGCAGTQRSIQMTLRAISQIVWVKKNWALARAKNTTQYVRCLMCPPCLVSKQENGAPSISLRHQLPPAGRRG
jgi:hypothetical protein